VAERWFKEALIYCLDVETFMDGNGDGYGDFVGLTSRLDYLARLGVTTLWLNPIHPTPNRDDGYDITDYYTVDPRLGTLGDFAEFLHQADNRGLRVMLDLVVNHTSDQHPWFQDARSDRESRHRDWYVWSDEKPDDVAQGVAFPGVQDTTWSFDRKARAWYFHRFYDFEPDLNLANQELRREIEKIVGFWLRLGVSGCRMDAAPFVIELTRANDPSPPKDFDFLGSLREHLSWRRGDAVILAEANAPSDELTSYFGEGRRLPMLFNFVLNQRLWLALARREVAPLLQGLNETPVAPESCQWATFLRNHDEVDLSRLTELERGEVFAAFGPDEAMQLYGRGIRRRLAPMLCGDRRRIELAYSLQFTLPGTPVLRYGEEIGMGDDLSLPERNAIRTPMQWNSSTNGGFSTAPSKQLLRRPITGGEYGYERVNVAAQERDSGSLLEWMGRTLRTLRECPEFGTARPRVLDLGLPTVLALIYDAPAGAMLALHNLGDAPVTVDVGGLPEQRGDPMEIYADDRYPEVQPDLRGLDLRASGYRWLRLRSTPGRG
jgi:maltose alpha-D-glucosyltransferase / alpha-amylase